MASVAPDPDEGPEPYILKGSQRFRPIPTWHWRVQRSALALAAQLDAWGERLGEPAYETFNHADYRLREQPRTSLRIPLSVVRGPLPALDSDWVPATPLVAVDACVGAESYGDIAARAAEYLECGVPVVWVLTPGFKTVTVHRPGADPVALDVRDPLEGFPELPGFSCRVAELFR